MQLKFGENFQGYKSIKNSFDIPEFKDFNVITGVNGSGKTHFLEAIEFHTGIEIEGIKKEETSFFDYKSFVLENEREVASNFISNQKSHINRELNNYFNDISNNVNFDLLKQEKIIDFKEKYNVFESLISDYDSIKQNIIEKFPSENERNSNRYHLITTNHSNYWQGKREEFNLSIKGNNIIKKYFPNRENFDNLTDEEIDKAILSNTDTDFLSSGFGEIFKKVAENINNLSQDNNLKPSEAETKFEKNNFQTPWNFINETLQSFSDNAFTFNYKVEKPRRITDNLKVKFINQTTKKEVEISDLSSGEKVLLTLTLFLYQRTIENNNFPKVLLLDEIDAVLHPSLCKKFIEEMKKLMIKNSGCKVILATHNPSTVAACDEEQDGIFIIEKSKKIEEQPKSKAIEILSSGLITLEGILKIIEKQKTQIYFEGTTDIKYFKKALEKLNITLSEVEFCDGGGDKKMKGTFEKIKKICNIESIKFQNHIFIFDCDTKHKEETIKNLHKFKIDQIEANPIKKGIENLFSKELLNKAKEYKEQFIDITGGHTKQERGTEKNIPEKWEVNENEKMNLCQWICQNATEKDFENFKPLIIDKIKKILG